MEYSRIEVRPIAGALGAEVSGIRLSDPLDDGTLGEIRGALLEHLVVFFRDQQLTPEQHKAFARRFGALDVHDYVHGMREHPEIIEVLKEPEERGLNFGGVWHSDVTYQEAPALGSVLYALEVPPYGGDTLFANQYMAYEALSPAMRALLDGLGALHSAGRAYGTESGGDHLQEDRFGSMQVERRNEAYHTVEHPVVRTHPETGRKGLFVNGVFTTCFAGMSEAESRPLLDFLCAHAVRPEFTCRFRWAPGSVAFWDNRCTQHFALNDYHGHRRRMHRVTITGDRPH